MSNSPLDIHAASVVAQSKKDRVPGLGRGPGLKNKLESPNTLKILQFHINGISTCAAKIKPDQILKLAEGQGVQIIALQETKLKINSTLKIKGYHIYRTVRRNKSGGGLSFLIRGINYQSIDINTRIINNTNLEIQGITVTWRGRSLNIFNMYHPPDLKSLPNEILYLFFESSICIGDLNVKHPTWGSTNINPRGIELLNVIDDKSS
ncbi:hypothetical protein AVEN_228151-1 [Araneus ventricosus]|uniref:Endonuclease/exonuclease/phosphatase domain-containing protein n=1 Tax=Araneus ventricosus TaxID=182803 RepID=A0A4Y2CVC4_ARAVE|nr:hypothetical protein AVEN_228151-1 [Araneus ventricosus]